MHQDYAILKRQDNIDAYFKDIEKIYVSNGWGSSYPEGLLRQMFSASYYLLATTTGSAVGFLRGFTDGAMVTVKSSWTPGCSGGVSAGSSCRNSCRISATPPFMQRPSIPRLPCFWSSTALVRAGV